jgi:uncharacterized protein (TIGR03085 family)
MTVDDRLLQRRERAALCDTLSAVGPDAPTKCEGWTALDLASHIVVRERDAWTAPVILCGRLNGIVQRLQLAERATGFEAVVARLRGGPPWLFRSTPQVVRLNTVEDWIHHEDVRRANGEGPRPAVFDLDDVLWKGIGAAGKVASLRLDDVGLLAVAPDGRQRSVRSGRATAELHGAPGEILLFLTGRTDVAQVELRGPSDAVDRVRGSQLRL